MQRPELMVPGKVYRFEVGLWATAQIFLRGHRLRVEVTSSDFPRYDRNLNTGGPFGEEIGGQAAVNTVYHDRSRPSHILLPILSPDRLEFLSQLGLMGGEGQGSGTLEWQAAVGAPESKGTAETGGTARQHCR
jgi:hypothetical protein